MLASPPPKTRLKVARTENVKPCLIPEQAGAVPDMPGWYRDALFKDPERQAFALLDAAALVNLTTRLELSGLQHACLFSGRALDELGEAAPWLCQLDWSVPFTRDLITQSDTPWHHFDDTSILYISTGMSLDQLRKSLRKITMAQDADGRSFYLRFWERMTLMRLVHDDTERRLPDLLQAGDLVMTLDHSPQQTDAMLGVWRD